jgi:mono/diheme cytochrome c family protein
MNIPRQFRFGKGTFSATPPMEALRGVPMKSGFRFAVVLAGLALSVSTVCFAQSTGEAIYKQKCMNCHGVSGLANSGIGKVMKVKPITDPAVRNMPEAEMIQATRNGMGKMEPYKDSLTDSQTRAVVAYFRTFLK